MSYIMTSILRVLSMLSYIVQRHTSSGITMIYRKVFVELVFLLILQYLCHVMHTYMTHTHTYIHICSYYDLGGDGCCLADNVVW